MSSVPIQLLIYVQPEPTCVDNPIIYPLSFCLEVQIGIPISFNISVLNLCDPNIDTVKDLVVTQNITGMTRSPLTNSSANITYVVFDWTPQASQLGYQQLCTIAVT